MAIWKSISVAALASAVALPVPQASAGIGDGIVGGLVGGVVSGIIVNEGAKARERERTTVTRKVYVRPYSQNSDSPTRASNREVQSSLNYFGFSAGYVDGVLGQQSRSAISQYQAYMGYPVTGRLTSFERDFLVTSHNRAQAGGSATAALIADLPDGTRGLLHHYREELAGGGGAAPAKQASAYGLPAEVAAAVDEIASSADPSAEQLLQRSGFLQLADLNNDGRTDYLIDTSVTGSSFWCGARDCAVSVFASTPSGYQRNDFLAHEAEPAMFTCERGDCRFTEDAATGGTTTMVSAPASQPQAAQPAAPALPRFAVPGSNPSLAAFCNRINVLTSSNGGMSTLANLDNPDRALSEQFCLARSYAIGSSDDLAAQVQGVSREEIESQCLGLVPALEAQTAALSLESRAAVLRQVNGFIAEAGMSPTEVATSGRLCLGVGYAIDDMSLALASALLLSGQGDAAYDELMGHHLWHGFGAGKRPELAEAWYDAAIRALDAGGEPAFAPTQGDRAELLRAAVFGGQQQGGSAQPALPTFKVGD